MVDSERRQYFRLKEDLLVEFREIEEYEFEKVRERMNDDFQKTFLKSILLNPNEQKRQKRTQEFEIFLAYLDAINRKLDTILEWIEKKRDRPSFFKCLFTVDVSGSGIRFVSPKRPQKPYLELVIYLPFSFTSKIRTIAEILRVKEEKKNGKSLWEVAARYIEITEEDRDLLVSYILKRQREMIKKSKADE
ncbi:MAG: PilZ domain-containing protein [Deltaproteobacteria bacterium]|nr:PilZ domain-containing protein [Deltaproteobacteria bacterium]